MNIKANYIIRIYLSNAGNLSNALCQYKISSDKYSQIFSQTYSGLESWLDINKVTKRRRKKLVVPQELASVMASIYSRSSSSKPLA